MKGDPEDRAPTPRDGTVYWQVGAKSPDFPSALPSRAEVVVLGGGLTGVSAALTLAEAGVDVLLLEAGRLGDGASGRNGGQLLTGVNLSFAELASLVGPDAARDIYRGGLLAVRHVVERIAGEEIACDFHQGGHIEAVRSPAALAELAEEREKLARLGYDQEILTGAALTERTGAVGYAGGLYDRASAALNPYRLVLGLATAAARRGARLVEGAPCLAVREEAGGLTLTTRGGRTVTAKAAVLALNAYAPDLFPAFHRYLVRRPSTVVATEPLPEGSPVLPGRPVLFEGWPSYFYIQRTGEGRLVFGGRTGAEGLPEALARRFPAAAGIGVAYRWQGLLDLSADFLPHVGRRGGRLYYALGYSGHGVALAVYLGHLVARWIVTGRRPEPFADLPLRPFRRGRLRRRHMRPRVVPLG